ncbi:MAG TPA: hypothetical protein PLO98_11095, partial [Bacteroidia bacterium]|nr:hypothetical protein [Bacteroidia bacterium]
MINKSCLTVFLVSVITVGSVTAKENIGQKPVHKGNVVKNTSLRITAPCNEPTAQTDLQINNVRARIFSAGDMWWNLVDGANSKA